MRQMVAEHSGMRDGARELAEGNTIIAVKEGV